MTKEKEEARRDEILKRLLKTPPQPRPERERKKKGVDVKGLHFLVIDGKMRVSSKPRRNADGSITADVYRNLEDFQNGRAMERVAKFDG